MSSNASSAPKNSPSELGQGSLSRTKTNRKPKSLKAARQKMTQYWMQKTIPLAIAVSVLPILGVGAVTYGVGQTLIGQVNLSQSQEQEKFQNSASQSLLLLILGIGATSLLAGGISWLWLKVFIRAIVKQSTKVANQADQVEVSKSLQDFGYTIGLLQEQSTIQDILETGAREVQAFLKADRVLVFFNGNKQWEPLQSEATTSKQSSLLESDLSRLSVPLEQLFDVPMGYVQVCSEVEGSDLPAPHQATLKAIKVKAQMVTKIALENQSPGILVAQCSQPRDWTDVEHQLFAAIAKQIGIALERKTSTTPAMSTPSGTENINQLWSDFHNHCIALSQSTRTQVNKLEALVQQSETRLEANTLAQSNLQQSQEQLEAQPKLLNSTETSVDRTISSMTDTQITLEAITQSSEQILDLGQTINQISSQIKSLADQINYEAMNASITAKKQSTDQSWGLDFTNQILRMTRELGRHTNELDKLSSRSVSESQGIVNAIDTGNEQMLISTEWLKESRQQLSQLVTMNNYIQSTLKGLIENQTNDQTLLTATHPQLVDFAQWLNQTVEQSETLLHSLEQGNQKALA